MKRTETAGYSIVQIALHWAIAALVLFQLVFGESMVAFLDAREEGGTVDPTDQSLATAHYWVGIAVLALVVLRIGVRLRQRAPAPAEGHPLLRRAATANHALFYALLVGVPVTGLMGYYLGDPWPDVHAWGKPVFITLIAVHASAALFHQFWLRDGTLRRMLVPGPIGPRSPFE